MSSSKHAGLPREQIDFVSHLKLYNIFPGEWESVFKGEGIEFSELKPFEPGDRPRDIDFVSLAQSGEEQVIVRDETRQMRIYIWADFSGSMRFGGSVFASKPLIRDIAIGLILFSAQKLYSPVGLYAFGLEQPQFFPPKMGERHSLEIWEWLTTKARSLPASSSGIEPALSSLVGGATPRNMVFFISDFQQKVFEGDFTELFGPVVSRFDLVPVIVVDPLESGEIQLPCPVRLRVASSARARELYCTQKFVQQAQRAITEHLEQLTASLRRLGLSSVVLSSASVEKCAKSLFLFFESRRREWR